MYKKLLMSAVVGAVLSSQATADVLQWNDGFAYDGAGGEENVISFDELDLNSDVGGVIQTDSDNSGDITGTESFVEFGGTNAVAFNLGGVQDTTTALNLNAFGIDGYMLWFDYNIAGSATGTDLGGGLLDIDVDFSSGSATLSLDNSVSDAVQSNDVALLSYSLTSGHCDLSTTIGVGGAVSLVQGTTGACNLQMEVTALTSGYFFDSLGNDLFLLEDPFFATMDITVEDLIGLNFFYAEAGDSQEFNIRHDGNQDFRLPVPEPTSIALLGLGLLGLGYSRKKAVK